MGVTIDRVNEPFALPARVVDAIAAPRRAASTGTGTAGFTLSPNAEPGREGREPAVEERRDGLVGARQHDRRSQGVSRDVVGRSSAKALGVRVHGVDARAGRREGRFARRASACIAAIARNMDEGWTRWMLEQYEFAVHDPEERRRPDEATCRQFDVLLFADEAEHHDPQRRTCPARCPTEYVGGIGMEGAANVRRFVERRRMAGGVGQRGRLRDLDARAAAAQHGAATRGRRSSSFPASLLRITTKPANPLAHGMEAKRDRDVRATRRRSQVVAPASEGKQRAPRDVDVYVEFPRAELPRQRVGTRRRRATSPAAWPPRACRSARARRW